MQTNSGPNKDMFVMVNQLKLILTVLPVWISVNKAECRTVKAVMDFQSHIKNMMAGFFFPLLRGNFLVKKRINSEQSGNFTAQALHKQPCVSHEAPTAGALLQGRDCDVHQGQALSFWHLSAIKVLRLKFPCCTMHWPTFPHQAGIYHGTSSLSISHRM